MVPSYETVPEHWKAPQGPYKQAPEEFGGRWYFVNPFTGPEPWKNEEGVPDPVYPEGFIEIFGERPRDRFKRVEWEQELNHYMVGDFPDGVDVSEAQATFQAWGMGEMVPFYNSTFGHMVGFPESPMKGYTIPIAQAVRATHLAIAGYQIRLVQEGFEVEKRHPFVPPHVWPSDD